LTDGIFYVNSLTRVGDVPDGTSHTVAMAESLLGIDTPRNSSGVFLAATPGRNYKFVLSFFGPPDLTDARCTGSQSFNSTTGNGNDPRGFAWCSGEYRTALYNHYYGPNSLNYDCVTSVTIDPTPGLDKPILYAAYGWRASRSAHSGGVNIVLADGSVHFLSEGIDAGLWKNISTRNGSETLNTLLP
jgi:prepilin-type processing-associated H-X9-DG protein